VLTAVDHPWFGQGTEGAGLGGRHVSILATKLAARKKIYWDAITDDYLLIMSGNNAGSGENGIKKKFDVGPNAGTSPAALSRLVTAGTKARNAAKL
jgi:hypothetical protein